MRSVILPLSKKTNSAHWKCWRVWSISSLLQFVLLTCPSESNHTDECTQTRLVEILICTNSYCHILHNMGISSTMPHSDLSVIRVPKNTTPTLPTVWQSSYSWLYIENASAVCREEAAVSTAWWFIVPSRSSLDIPDIAVRHDLSNTKEGTFHSCLQLEGRHHHTRNGDICHCNCSFPWNLCLDNFSLCIYIYVYLCDTYVQRSSNICFRQIFHKFINEDRPSRGTFIVIGDIRTHLNIKIEKATPLIHGDTRIGTIGLL